MAPVLKAASSMRQFSEAEIRLTKGDLLLLVGEWMNDKMFNLYMNKHIVTNLTLHPNNKYVARITLAPIPPKNKEPK